MHSVKAPMIVVRVPGAQGGEAYMNKGRILPDTVAKKEIARLLELGLIEEVPDEAELIVAVEAERVAAVEAEFEQRVQEAAAKIVAEEFAPEFDQKVLEAAEKLEADRLAAAAAGEQAAGEQVPPPAAGSKPPAKSAAR